MTEDLIKVYPSSLPRIMSCPASLGKPEIDFRLKYSGSTEGTACSEFGEALALNGSKGFNIDENIAIVNERNGCTADWLCWNLFFMFKGIEQKITSCEPEKVLKFSIANFLISGKVDLLCHISETEKALVDWKSGHRADTYTEQLMGYAICLFDSDEKIELVHVIEGNLKEKELFSITVTRKDVDKFLFDLGCVLTTKKESYQVGNHCKYCPKKFECKAHAQYMSGTISALNEELPQNPAEFAELYERVGQLEKMIKNFKDEFKVVVKDNEQIISGGKIFTINETEVKKWTLTNKNTQMIPEEYLKIDKTAMKKYVMANAERGQKKEAWECFERDFENCDPSGVEVTTQEKLTEKKYKS